MPLTMIDRERLAKLLGMLGSSATTPQGRSSGCGASMG
jgi:hypothetical protein